TSAGVLADTAKNTIVLEFNDKEAVRSVLNAQHKQIAAIILEPVCGNMGVVLPNDDFLVFLRKITEKHNILLIFDEVITGFRFFFFFAQKLFKVRPDITCLGKIIGGGLPIGAYGGNSSIMEQVSPLGKMYQAGTLSGNPVAVTAGIETLRILKNADYKKLNSLCDHLCKEISAISKDICVNHIGPMFTIFFTKHCVNDYKQAMTADIKRYAGFFHALLNQGVYFAPSQFEANFVSFAHTKKDIEYTLRVIRKVLKRI
ncbi:MAG: aminotransferase class III-fold pyridoxal phosphate-dependent enzyme, partial [Candidatus Omnitrophica bacterium]|nr:aminotransferase class III-fold pyridoxal phosphate-dependent enzyme [Candidatus Omnitrophota bacterium]